MKPSYCFASTMPPTTLITKGSSAFFYVTLIVFTLVFLGWSSSARAVGFKWVETYNLRIGVWYPSTAPETEVRLGPFDATPKEGKYQIILMSHGNLGRLRNHHLTAKALASAGFIVVAPLHSADHLMAGDDIANVLEWRVTELRFALEALLQDDAMRPLVDLSRVHALGYSLGALSALNAAGASIDIPAADMHCEINLDPAFCETPSWIQRWRVKRLRDTQTPNFPRTIQRVHFPLGFVTGAIAVVAPVGQGMGVDPSTFLGRKLLVIGLEDDEVTLPNFHASNIAAVFTDVVQTHLDILPGHHSAFIAPFAKRVTDVEYIPAAIDPEGFDRHKFLSEVNMILTDFFDEARH